MRRRALILALVVATLPTSSAALAGGAVSSDSYGSAALGGTVPFSVYLPAGYATSGLRYPTIYFLHGLPAAPYAYRGIGFLAKALDAAGRPAILVAPQGARDGDSDPEYLDWGPGRNWETAVSQELPAYVDAHYRTIAERRGRALVGLSAGGYGAVLLTIHHLDAFSVVESWSGYFHPTDPTGSSPLDAGSPDRNTLASAHSFVRSLRAGFRELPTFFAFYVGRGDALFRAENVLLDSELIAAGVPHVFEIYAGAHAQTVWSTHASQWLALALDHLARPR